MAPSRPVSARRSGNNDAPEKVVVQTHLIPRNMAEAKARSRTALAEVAGSLLVRPCKHHAFAPLPSPTRSNASLQRG
jgi:hypothetical protein